MDILILFQIIAIQMKSADVLQKYRIQLRNTDVLKFRQLIRSSLLSCQNSKVSIPMEIESCSSHSSQHMKSENYYDYLLQCEDQFEQGNMPGPVPQNSKIHNIIQRWHFCRYSPQSNAINIEQLGMVGVFLMSILQLDGKKKIKSECMNLLKECFFDKIIKQVKVQDNQNDFQSKSKNQQKDKILEACRIINMLISMFLFKYQSQRVNQEQILFLISILYEKFRYLQETDLIRHQIVRQHLELCIQTSLKLTLNSNFIKNQLVLGIALKMLNESLDEYNFWKDENGLNFMWEYINASFQTLKNNNYSSLWNANFMLLLEITFKKVECLRRTFQVQMFLNDLILMSIAIEYQTIQSFNDKSTFRKLVLKLMLEYIHLCGSIDQRWAHYCVRIIQFNKSETSVNLQIALALIFLYLMGKTGEKDLQYLQNQFSLLDDNSIYEHLIYRSHCQISEQEIISRIISSMVLEQ